LPIRKPIAPRSSPSDMTAVGLALVPILFSIDRQCQIVARSKPPVRVDQELGDHE
jgi:hypothetical protein